MNLVSFILQLFTATRELHSKDLKWVNNKDSIVLIDMENVRGKAFFQVSHREILKRTTLWTKLYNLEGRVSIIVDHGSEQNAYYLPEGGISMVFSGPAWKADDILARDVSFFGRNVCVVTADNNLISRCKSSIDRESDFQIEFLKPIKFLKTLERLNERVESERSVLAKDTQGEGSLSQRTLEKQSRMLCKHLASKECSQNKNDLFSLIEAAATYDQNFEDPKILEWEKSRESTRRKEKTNDRIFLAEHFRQKVKDESAPDAHDDMFRYVKYIQDIGSKLE